MNINELIRANVDSNKKVCQSIMAFNEYPETVAKWNEFTNSVQAKSMRLAKHNCPCPVCGENMKYYTDFQEPRHPTIDHKHAKFLSRHLVLENDNLWVICWACNKEKKNMTWTAYEYWIEDFYGKDSRQYKAVISNRPNFY